MSSQLPARAPLAERLQRLGPEDFRTAVRRLASSLDAASVVYLESCVRCGLCAESCHYFLDDRNLKSMPAYKLNLIIRVFQRHFRRRGRLAAGWTGARDFNRQETLEWLDSLYGRCTLCGRCALNCTMGINIPALIRKARGILTSMGLAPDGLDAPAATARDTGNNMGISREDWVETVAWLEEELRAEVGDPQIKLPLDRKAADILYMINPREAKFSPLTLMAAAKIFHAAQARWTLSSSCFDLTNYAYFTGDDDLAAELASRLQKAMSDLEARTLVLAECGHGFSSNRWEAPEWLSRKIGYEVKSVVTVVADYLRAGRIHLDPGRQTERVTLHDPCQLVRLGGIVEDQRLILRRAVQNFVEMTPNREKNYCCGGGGGQLSMTDFASRRRSAGRIKADQIAKTRAGVVAAPCHNCLDQLAEINKHYRLGVKVKSVIELAAEALVLKKG